MQSQPNHIEIVVEKNTVAGLIQTVSGEFTIPQTSGRGFCSLPPRRAMLKRFRQSGKEKLVVLLVSDFDADGECIAESFARSMRDDFGVVEARLHPVKVALTHEQVQRYGLPSNVMAKSETSRSKAFISKYGEFAWELEALLPATLQDIVRAAIVSVLDMDLFEREQLAEQQDAVKLRAIRETVQEALRDVQFATEGGAE